MVVDRALIPDKMVQFRLLQMVGHTLSCLFDVPLANVYLDFCTTEDIAG